MLTRSHRGETIASLGEAQLAVRRHARSSTQHDVTLGGRRWTLSVYAAGERFAVFAPEGSATLHIVDPIAHAGDAAGEGRRLTARCRAS